MKSDNTDYNFQFIPLTINRWNDLLNLFGKNGACGGCWCMYWRLSHKEYEQNKGENNKVKLVELIKKEAPLGIMAYYDETPVGWCSVSPKTSLVRLEKSRNLKSDYVEDTWSITCLFIHKKFRNQGLSTALIKAASAYAFEKGARLIEAYPIVPRLKKMPEVFAWVGFANAYFKANFVEYSQPTDARLIVRLEKS